MPHHTPNTAINQIIACATDLQKKKKRRRRYSKSSEAAKEKREREKIYQKVKPILSYVYTYDFDTTSYGLHHFAQQIVSTSFLRENSIYPFDSSQSLPEIRYDKNSSSAMTHPRLRSFHAH